MAKESKKVKIEGRERRKLRLRKKIKGTNERPRICTFRSSKHTYAHVVSDLSGKVLFGTSTKDKMVAEKLKSEKISAKSISAAKMVGARIAELCQGHNVESVVFDRNGFLYHGRVKAVADGAREGGLKF